MKLFNTLSRKKEEFKPLQSYTVKLYTCGPTVYHYAHIGNLRNVIFNDTLRRTLEGGGYTVKHIMNVTDVGHLSSDADEGEDKMESGAFREGKTVWEVADYYLEAFNRHTKALKVKSPTRLIKATDTIPTQIKLIEKLFDKGFAYKAKQAIYFDTSKLPDYGKLTGQDISQKEIGARDEVVRDPEKKNPQDFALWFFTIGHFKDHEMRWDSPWGSGFPGWHLECSAIIHESLGEPIDIHTGGVDHIGTHHTNEIAQTEAAFGKPLAHTWLHNEFLLQEGGKMAKSGSSTIILDDLTEKKINPLALRLLYLQAHYRSQQNFTWESLEAAQNLLYTLYEWADLSHQEAGNTQDKLFQEFKKHMEDDLNTPMALSTLAQMTKQTPTKNLLENIENYLGLDLNGRLDIDKTEKILIKQREEARKAHNFAEADEARNKLLGQGIEVKDTSDGPRWRRVRHS